MNKTQTVVIRGKTSFCKLLEDQLHLNYDKTGKQWATDIVIDSDTEKEMKKYGVADRVKRKDGYVGGQPFMTFKQKELRRDGEENDPVKIVDAAGKAWDQSSRIGNDSVVDMKLNIVDFGTGKKKGIYIKAMRVLDHVPYEDGGFPPLSEDDEFYEAAKKAEAEIREAAEDRQFKKDFGLDDELPFD